MSKSLIALIGLLVAAVGGWQFGTVIDPMVYSTQGYVLCAVTAVGLMLLAVRGV